MKWTTIIFVLLAILAIASAGHQKKYGKRCSGNKCLEKGEKFKEKRQLEVGKKNEKLTRQKRSYDEVTVEADVAHGKEELKEKAKDNLKSEALEKKETKEQPKHAVETEGIQKGGLERKASRKNAEKKKLAKEIEKQKAGRKANRQKIETPKAEEKQKATKESSEEIEVSRGLKARLNEKKKVASELNSGLNVEAHSRSKRSRSSEPELSTEAEPILEIAVGAGAKEEEEEEVEEAASV